MTVPPNYGPPPEQPQTPDPTPEPSKRRRGLVGGIIVGAMVLVLGAVLLVTMNLKDDDEDVADSGADRSASASEAPSEPEDDATTPEDVSEVGRCLPFESQMEGSGFALVDCADPNAFWEVTAQSYDVADIPVDDEGELTDTAPVYALCGEDWGANVSGEAWTKWDYVHSSGSLDSLYCLRAIGNPDPAEPEHLPYVPGEGDCFDDSASWWRVDCGSDLARYEVVKTIELDEPVADMSEEDAEAQTLECGSDLYWPLTDLEDRTRGFLCGNKL